MGVSALQFFHILRFGVLIIIGILLVKFGYDLEEIGTYELFFFMANVISFFWTMGLNNGLMSYYPSLSKEKQSRLLFNIGLLLLALGLVASLFLYLFSEQIRNLLRIEGDLHYLELIVCYVILSAPGNFTEYVYLLKGKTKSITRYAVFLFGLQLILLSIGIFLGFSVKSLLMLMVAWASVKFICFSIEIVRGQNFEIDFQLIGTFLLFSLPLIFHMLLGNGMEYVDGFLVTHFFGEESFAQFRYGARELPLVTVLIGAISTALIPIAVNEMSVGLEQVKLKIRRMMNLLFPISIVLMLVSPFAFPFFYSDDFRISAQVFNVYLLIISSRILMPQVVLFAKHENGVLLISALIELVVNVVLSLFLLQRFGMVGIAWATVIAFIVNKVILLSVAWFKYGIRPSAYLNVKLYGVWLLILILSYYISTFYH